MHRRLAILAILVAVLAMDDEICCLCTSRRNCMHIIMLMALLSSEQLCWDCINQRSQNVLEHIRVIRVVGNLHLKALILQHKA